MSKPAPATLTPEQYAERLDAEKTALTLHYCNAFKFWRACPLRLCRKARTCSGDANACLKRREHEVPREDQWRARQQILAATPAHAGPPERTAREFLPRDLPSPR